MSLQGAYDDTNIFARIIRGEIPSVPIFEDDDVLAFMDAFPQSRGHCLMISKTSRARNILDVEPEVLAVLSAAVQRLARAVRKALVPDGIVVTQFNGAPAGQTVFHLHIHVIPRWEGQTLGRHAGGMADIAELKSTADMIRAALD
ncbi:MAG: HIT family protein [Caulobacter sp.]|nr:HIT family protein [Caulobacter sp.]